MNDSSVREILFDKKFTQVYQKTILNLPTNGPYFLFTTSNREVVNAVKDDLTSKITKINENLNKRGHVVIPKSNLEKKIETCNDFENVHFLGDCWTFKFKIGIQVGEKFWVLHAITDECKYFLSKTR